MYGKTKIVTAGAISFLLLLTAVIYWQGLDGPFLLDDYLNIDQSHVDSFSREEIYYAITHNESGLLGRPVSVLSLVLTGIVHGPDPWGYKYHNLLIHLLNGLLIFWLLVKLLPRLSPGTSVEKNLLVAGITSGIWLLHPLMVSTVLYAVQRMAQLSALFTLASLLVYIEARECSEKQLLKFYLLAYLAFPVCLLLSVFSKENGALIPVYILAIELIAYQLSPRDFINNKHISGFLAIFVFIPLTLGSVYLLTHLDSITNYALRDFNMGERLMTELRVVLMYVKMIMLPRLADMTLFHDYIQVTRSFDMVTGLLLALFIAVIGLGFYLRKRVPVISFAIAWFVVSHLLESTIISLELMFEHRNYLAAVGPLFAVVYFLCNCKPFPKLQYVNAAFFLLVIMLTVTRVQEWTHRETIFNVAIMEHPDSYRAQTEMANLQYQAGNIQAAVEHLEIVQNLREQDFGPVIHQAVYLCGSGTDLTPWFEKAEERASQFPVTTYSLSALDNMVAVLNNGDCPELDPQDILSLVNVAKHQSDNLTSEQYLGFLEKIEGHVQLIIGNPQLSMSLMLSAYERTGMVIILENMVEVLLHFDRLTEAEQIINYISEINAESRGTETAILIPLQEQLEAAKRKREAN